MPHKCAINTKTVRYLSVKISKFLIISLLLLYGLESRAQYDVAFAHYFDMEPQFNPAAAGKQDKLNLTGAYALDMAGFEHNPRTFFVGADMALMLFNQRHGVGAQLMNDQIGLFTHQKLALQYAYKHRLLGGTISAGLQVGLISEQFDGSKADVPEDPSDPVFSSSDIDGSGFDISLGLYYQHGPWYIGASAQHLNGPNISMGETNELKIDPIYYFTGGYNIRLRNPFLSIQPSFLVRYDSAKWREDLTARLVYRHEAKMLYGGIGYSPDTSVTFLVGGNYHGVVVGYSYEYYTTALNPGNGSHEFFVGYQIDLNLAKKGKNKHQSVRLL